MVTVTSVSVPTDAQSLPDANTLALAVNVRDEPISESRVVMAALGLTASGKPGLNSTEPTPSTVSV
jgi:hypothetical protein